ncbi:MAG: V-type ATPase subunit [Spirochaetales bacterium]|nr:V-type ATPase subunit [Spirochaetales bacterium]
MRGALSTYGFLSAKLKARISKTLPPDAMERLIRARSLPEAVQFLKGTEYAAIEEAYAATGDLRSGEALLLERELELYTGLFRYLDEPVLSFVRALALRFEVDKIKNAVRLWFDSVIRGRNVDGKSGYLHRATIVHAFDVDAVILAPDADAVVAAFGSTPYAAIARSEMPRVVSGRSVFPFELALDRYYYAEAFAAAAKLGRKNREVAERVLGVDVDMQNVSWLVRFRGFYGMDADTAAGLLIPRGRAIDAAALKTAGSLDQGSPGYAGSLGLELLRSAYGQFGVLLGSGSGGDAVARLSLMEGALRQIARAEAGRSLAGYPFSIGVVLAYFTLRAEELRAVMTILNAKEYALPEERIRSSL